MKNSGLFLFFILLGLLGCRKQQPFVVQERVNEQIVTHFDIPEQQPLQDPLKLSDLVKNVRIVPLETSEEAVIGGNAEYYIGDSFILVFQEENILLFDAAGHFIRTVAWQGRAPIEFGEVGDYAVDEENELLYVLDKWARHVLKCFHLKDSAYFKTIETVETVNNAVKYRGEGELMLAPYPYGEVKYYWYCQTPAGELKEHLPYRSNRERRPVFKRLLYRVNDEFRYLSAENMFSENTVYTVSPTRLQPTWIFHCDDKKHYKILGETPEYLFFEFKILKSTQEEQATEGAKVVILDYDSRSFYYDKRKGELAAIEGILDDCFSGEIQILGDYVQIQNGNILFITVPAMSFFQEKEQQAGSENTVKYPETWQKVAEQVVEDSNPLLIIADIK